MPTEHRIDQLLRHPTKKDVKTDMFTARRRPKIAAICTTAVLVSIIAWTHPAHATPPAGASGELVALSTTQDRITMRTTGPSDIRIVKIVIEPGGHNGWHSHPGTVLISVRRGTATTYQAHDLGCMPHRYRAGEAFVEVPRHVHIVRNEGTRRLIMYATSVTPIGESPSIDEPAPGNCPF
jgi:quercetin dioxygenase-like cupin family protein